MVVALPDASVTVAVGVYDPATSATRVTTLSPEDAVPPVSIVFELVIVPASLLLIVDDGVVSFDGVVTSVFPFRALQLLGMAVRARH